MKKINLSGGTLSCSLDIPNLPTTSRILTIEDFNGSQIRYDIYKQMVSTFENYEKRMAMNAAIEPMVAEDKKNSDHQ